MPNRERKKYVKILHGKNKKKKKEREREKIDKRIKHYSNNKR